MPDTPQFPPKSWLGYGLDLTSVTPVDITTVTNHILRAARLIKLPSGGTVQTYGDVTWTVPDGVDVASDVANAEVSLTSYANGSDAASDLEANAALSGKYMAVSAGVSANYAINKTFHSRYQYSMFNFRQVLLEVGLEDFAPQINVAELSHYIKKLPRFDHMKGDIVKEYKNFFGAVGSHVVTGATYGSRFQLNVWASNEDESVNSSFKADVNAEFNGLTASGKFDASVKTSDQYKKFQQSVQKLCSCQGGDTKVGTKISADPTADGVYGNYETWVDSSQKLPGVMTLHTMALWELMTAALDDDLNDRATDFENAFDWIVANPLTHHTKCSLVINSDWGEIGLLNPSAFILPDKDSKNQPPDDNNVTFSNTKIIWGREHSHDFKRQIRIDFIIENDGSPVDIELSHGSDGATPGSGSCKAIIGDEKPYENTGIKDNNWNTQWFYRCPVNPNPMPNQ